ncbi:hypothetical protein [Photorhabdus namnaonensis]|uniref:Uncharacterized protein n=1 Tax=Photorhabdus namnaonensis TaxID=1851568 RepID=A0A1B8YDH4_9GAMM|nr:hypothetical protein Phpb_04144 [Photorhabdus namnaonensis]
MNNRDRLFPIIKDDIAFDTLLTQAKTVIEQQSGQCWNDMGENDPGITLLEACCYGASDLAYRHSLPLKDLLTPKQEERTPGDGIFPKEFGPQQILTCGPITEEDYRRALLDLHSNDKIDGYFFFNDVQLIREPKNQRYTYWYNKQKRQYSFIENQSSSTEDPFYSIADQHSDTQQLKLTLRGNYWLYLLPSRETQANNTLAQTKLKTFLKDNRNLGESVSKIIWLEPVDLSLKIDIQLDDDVKDIADIFAKVYKTAEQMVLEKPQRYTTQAMKEMGYNNEEIFNGPYLHHGWLPQLPSIKNYTESRKLNLSPLVNQLLDIKGIKNITQLTLDKHDEKISKLLDDNWSWEIAQGYYPRLWGDDPLKLITSPDSPLTITAKGGVKVKVSKQDIKNKIIPEPLTDIQPELMNWGKHRKVLDYYPVSNKLPACYGLQTNTQQQIQLHQFILPFEQMLANNCAELSLLPKLLAFKQRGNTVYGTQWPFKENSVGQNVHKSIKSNLINEANNEAKIDNNDENYAKELVILDYLLRYFGVQRATPPLPPSSQLSDSKESQQDFLSTQREYLAQQSNLAYQRNNIRIDKVSALQKRIAARLGLGGECFSETPELDKLPFYLIEHRQLLPVKPDEKFNEKQTPNNLEIQDNEVKITHNGIANQIKQDQLINLSFSERDEYENTKTFTLQNQMITQVTGDTFTLNINNSSDLENNKDKIKTAFEQGNLLWQNSPIWMKDMDYQLVYANKLHKDNERWITINDESYFPAMIEKNDEITLKINPDYKLNTYIEKFDHDKKQILLKRESGSKNYFPLKEAVSLYYWSHNDYLNRKNELIYAGDTPSNNEEDERWIALNDEDDFESIFNHTISTINFSYKCNMKIKEFNYGSKKILIKKDPDSKSNFPNKDEASMYSWHTDKTSIDNELIYSSDIPLNTGEDERWITVSDAYNFQLIFERNSKEIILELISNYKPNAYIEKFDYDKKQILLKINPYSKSNFPQNEMASLYSWHIVYPYGEIDRENELVYTSDIPSNTGEDERWISVSDEDYFNKVFNEGKIYRKVILKTNTDYTFNSYIKEFDPIEKQILLGKKSTTTNDFPIKEIASLCYWHFSGERYAKADHFSFMVSVVLNRELIGSREVDLDKLESWVKAEILAELPAHISLVIHWLSPEHFEKFASIYKHWQNSGAPLGDQAYKILETLTLGKQPATSIDTITDYTIDAQ